MHTQHSNRAQPELRATQRASEPPFPVFCMWFRDLCFGDLGLYVRSGVRGFWGLGFGGRELG